MPCDARFPSAARPFDPVDASRLAGEYRLILVTTRAQERGRATEGRLSLWLADTLRRYYEPRYLTLRDSTDTTRLRIRSSHVVTDSILGWHRSGVDRPVLGALEIDLRPVGASAKAHLSSRDPNEPGARLEGEDLQLTPARLGLRRADEPSTTLHLRAVDDRGFYGRWTADIGYGLEILDRNGRTVPEPFGYFCARRL